MEPPVRVDDGSTASTATWWLCSSISLMPIALMKVDLPAPGTPEMPTRNALPVYGLISCSNSWACARCSGLVDSTRVMALATWPLDPSTTLAASSATLRFRMGATISPGTVGDREGACRPKVVQRCDRPSMWCMMTPS